MLGVIIVAEALPDGRALAGVQQVPKRRHAAVVKIGSAGPNAVKRRRDVADGLVDVLQLAEVGEPTLAVGIAMRWRQGIQAHRVCFDFVDRNRLFRIAAAWAVRAMASGADAVESDAAALGEI